MKNELDVEMDRAKENKQESETNFELTDRKDEDSKEFTVVNNNEKHMNIGKEVYVCDECNAEKK